MKKSRVWNNWLVTAAILAGCGGGSTPPSTETAAQPSGGTGEVISAAGEHSGTTGGVLPTAGAVAAKKKSLAEPEEDEDIVVEVPQKNTPEWFIFQITQLKLKPLSTAAGNDPQQVRRERNLQVVDLATEAIVRTHKDDNKKQIFASAVHHLLEAELQLALTGDREHIDALYEHAGSLYERDKTSKPAIEAGQTLVTFARTNAQRFGQQEPKWLEEYARLSRQFAEHFPQEDRQATALLFAAGQSCEFHGLTAEAVQCYAVIRERFPESSSAERVTPILRRLNLKGKPLQLAGPMIGGGYFKAEESLGRPLLVIFWSTQAQPFVRQLSAVQKLLEQIDAERLNVISVNFDDDDNDSAVQTFLETNGLNWPTIFHAEPGKRGWNNPLATHYGIHSVPQYWVVSSKGNIVEMAHDVKHIEPLLSRLMVPRESTNAPKP